jgi:hypothetical protein
MILSKTSRQRQYFEWLYTQVFPIDQGAPFRRYTVVCQMMNDIPFLVIVSRDDNRVADGAQLRNAFVRDSRYEPLDEAELLYPDASILEVLVGLALKAEKLIEISPHDMFKIFLENLGLDNYYDDSPIVGIRNKIDRKLRRFNNRSYTSKGKGGLFPLMYDPEEDQRAVELWYQMGAYMAEKRMY